MINMVGNITCAQQKPPHHHVIGSTLSTVIKFMKQTLYNRQRTVATSAFSGDYSSSKFIISQTIHSLFVTMHMLTK